MATLGQWAIVCYWVCPTTWIAWILHNQKKPLNRLRRDRSEWQRPDSWGLWKLSPTCPQNWHSVDYFVGSILQSSQIWLWNLFVIDYYLIDLIQRGLVGSEGQPITITICMSNTKQWESTTSTFEMGWVAQFPGWFDARIYLDITRYKLGKYGESDDWSVCRVEELV